MEQICELYAKSFYQTRENYYLNRADRIKTIGMGFLFTIGVGICDALIVAA